MCASKEPTVFISYCHADGKKWCVKFEQQLKPLVPEKLLKVWSDRDLGVGDYWYDAVVGAIENADIALLLITPDYLNSDFIKRVEIPRILERRSEQGMLVVPVICHPCMWRRITWLSKMLVRPHDGRPLSLRSSASRADADITLIIEEILNLVDK